MLPCILMFLRKSSRFSWKPEKKVKNTADMRRRRRHNSCCGSAIASPNLRLGHGYLVFSICEFLHQTISCFCICFTSFSFVQTKVGNRKELYLVKLKISMAKIGRQSRINHSQGEEILNFLPFLPLDIIFNILILLPADFLYNSVRYVCKAWASIIRDPSFIKEHLLKSKVGLLIQQYTIPSRGLYLDIERGKLSGMHLRRCCPGKPIDSCRGLCLFFIPYGCHLLLGQKGKRPDDSRALYVVNPVTMQIEVLPSLGDGCVQYCHLAYIIQTGQFMVVSLFKNSGIVRGLVMTLGIDVSWRKLNLPRAGRILDKLVNATSVVVGQVVYLAQSGTELVAINLYDETNFFIPLPNRTGCTSYWLLKLGDNLSCLVHEDSGMNVYVLRDSKKCEWAKVCQIADVITSNKLPLFCLLPLGWLDNGRIVVLQSKLWCFRGYNFIIALNVETGDAMPLSFSYDVPFHHILIHTNSLVTW